MGVRLSLFQSKKPITNPGRQNSREGDPFQRLGDEAIDPAVHRRPEEIYGEGHIFDGTLTRLHFCKPTDKRVERIGPHLGDGILIPDPPLSFRDLRVVYAVLKSEKLSLTPLLFNDCRTRKGTLRHWEITFGSLLPLGRKTGVGEPNLKDRQTQPLPTPFRPTPTSRSLRIFDSVLDEEGLGKS